MVVPITLAYPAALLLGLAVIPFFYFSHRRQDSVGHSFVALTDGIRSFNWIAGLGRALLAVSWLALCIAVAQPRYADGSQFVSRQSRDLAVAVDISNSMTGVIPGGGENEKGKPYRRIDAAKDAVCDFIVEREGDRIALMTFSDSSYYVWPLSSDIELLSRKCGRISDQLVGGTNFQGPSDGNSARGALQAPLDHLLEMSDSASRVVIIVTDGEADIDDVRFAELAAQYEQNRIALYVVGVGEGWTTGSENERTEPLRRFVERVNGKVYAANDRAGFARAMQDIDAMETSQVLQAITVQQELYRHFLIAALCAWALYLIVICVSGETL